MFTGLIEFKSDVIDIVKSPNDITCLSIKRPYTLEPVYGESIAVNGCCLTVTEFDEECIRFDVNSESMSLTNLCELKAGDSINLERAMLVSDRLGGHIVSGHVEGTCEISKITREVDGDIYEFKVSKDYSKYFIHKGSVTLNGVSLTINSIKDFVKEGYSLIEVNLIPTTLNDTNLGDAKVGQKINLETDLLGKYVERFSVFQK